MSAIDEIDAAWHRERATGIHRPTEFIDTLFAEARAERDALLAELSEYRTLRPVKCNPKCYQAGWKAAQEAAIKTVDDLDGDEITNSEAEYRGQFKACLSLIKQIRALVPPVPPADCGGKCNPLEPDAAQLDYSEEVKSLARNIGII